MAVHKKAKARLETRNFLILLRPNNLACNRLGVTVTKKVGNAVTRNRIKRHVREFFRNNRHLLVQGRDIVVVAYRGAAEVNHLMVGEELQVLLDRPIK